MGGHQVTSAGSGDDGYDEEGYDESQRAEILEATRNGPTDGLVLTDLEPDLGDDGEDEPIDELDMEDDEVGESDSSVPMAQADIDEDHAQEGFEADDDEDDDDDDLDDADDFAIKP